MNNFANGFISICLVKFVICATEPGSNGEDTYIETWIFHSEICRTYEVSLNKYILKLAFFNNCFLKTYLLYELVFSRRQHILLSV